jgi:hypothetical protein
MNEGFEFDGMWITDRTKSPCGRFDLSPEQADELYGKDDTDECTITV